MPAEVPTIVATSIGFRQKVAGVITAGPTYPFLAQLANAGPRPRICVIATAVGDDPATLIRAYSALSGLGMQVSHLALYPMPNVEDIRAHLRNQDVIWVGGGSVANLLALWRVHGLDEILYDCWQAGVVLSGVSAGSLCWHVGGTTDSFGLPLRPVTNGLGFLPWANSVHHDGEEQRRPTIHRLVGDGTLPDAYASDDGVALVYRGTALDEVVTEVEGKQGWRITRTDHGVCEEPLPTRLLS